ncbi:MAG: branched-chain amino acid ABC transporter permease, partial [Actinobacteria bacterium]|nr:branched-chain amino acid ABC transporter permease [Actinomycetota bacterium]NIS29857.1 branched-chain amino acid ABC transporter permease [Actinomycetota bacterium]NIU18380.1 branched-chain amino acid ABC transporter permease [Actinomycetota bacterium]NIU65155.1 branched-chain amino acid ABC transporter permease [Actinomycetota bacterium]NIW26963.1 branched-chain amino acid ABC transporter permease [Actinomycetota bacterium]
MTSPTPKTAFWEGVRTILPMLLGIVPFGVIVGITAAGTEIGGL